jgi:hypothetical protein
MNRAPQTVDALCTRSRARRIPDDRSKPPIAVCVSAHQKLRLCMAEPLIPSDEDANGGNAVRARNLSIADT